MIELLVTLSIIGMLIALLLPAVLASREAARRSQCASNLGQLALAAHNYQADHGCFPMGTPFRIAHWGVGRTRTAFYTENHSIFVAMLPQLGNQALFDAANFVANINTPANLTIHRTRTDSLLCPNDPGAWQIDPMGVRNADFPPGLSRVAHASYAGCTGTWYHATSGPSAEPSLEALAAQDNGIFYANSSTTPADITDGVGNTLLLGERITPAARARFAKGRNLWYDGCIGSTLFHTMAPPSPHRSVPRAANAPPDKPGLAGDAYINSASSNHPGGANFAFADGSVRFLLETIQSWPVDPSTGNPVGVKDGNGTFDGSTFYILLPGIRPGIYQALSTRNGGEGIKSDRF